MSSKVAEVTQRASLDKDRFVTEIADLKRKLDESRSADDPEMARKNAEVRILLLKYAVLDSKYCSCNKSRRSTLHNWTLCIKSLTTRQWN